MATIKAYTDVSQSKMLAEILPLESADMYYSYYHNPISGASYYEEYPIFHIPINKNKSLHCWSLASLLGVLPNGIVMNKDSQTGRYHFSFKYIGTSVTADNPLDACVAMIEKLHELKML